MSQLDSSDVSEAKAAVRKAKKALLAATRDFDRHAGWRALKHEADLLAANLHRITPGTSRLEVTDYLDDGSEQLATLELDPAIPPSRQLSTLYRRAAKGERGERMAAQRVEDLRHRLELAESELRDAELLAQAPESGLPAASDFQRSGSPFKQQPAPQSQPATPLIRGLDGLERSLRPRVCHTESGAVIMVGRSSTGNDYLTTRLANGNDWFFHVAGTPGSHVILRWSQRDTMPPRDDMESAAMLALHFSKLKDASRATVTYCQRKHVTKPKGAAPGLVYVRNGKSMTVRIDKAKLARLLGKELDGEQPTQSR